MKKRPKLPKYPGGGVFDPKTGIHQLSQGEKPYDKTQLINMGFKPGLSENEWINPDGTYIQYKVQPFVPQTTNTVPINPPVNKPYWPRRTDYSKGSVGPRYQTQVATFALGGLSNEEPIVSAADQDQINQQNNRNLNAGQYMAIGQGIVNTTGNLTAINNSDYTTPERQVATGQALNQGVDTVAGSVLPWYQYAQMGKNVAKGVIGNNPSSNTNRAWNALATPMHEQAITDASKGNWGDAAGDILGAGFYSPIKSYFNKNNTYAMGGLSNSNAEVEKEEVMMAPNGSTMQVDGPTHANGGVPVNIPSGTQIYSDRLKVPGTKKTFAKIAERYKTNKEDKILSEDNTNALTKKTAELISSVKQRKLDDLFKAQEQLKKSKLANYAKKLGLSSNNEFANGGIFDEDPVNYTTPSGIRPLEYKQDNSYLFNQQLPSPFYQQPMEQIDRIPLGTAGTPDQLTPSQRFDLSTDTRPKTKSNFDYSQLIEPAANTLIQNAGNIAYLAGEGKRYDKQELYNYNPELLSAKEELRNADIQSRVTRDRLRDLTGGNAGAYLSNLTGAQTANTLNKVQIQQQIDNTNKGIMNDAKIRNIASKYQVDDINAKNKGQALTNYYSAISGIGANTSGAYKDYKAGKQDQDTLDMISQMYPNYKYDKQKKGWFHRSTGKKLKIGE